MTKLLFFSGSSQKNSMNTRLLRAAANLASTKFGDGIVVTRINLADFDMPAYDGRQVSVEDMPRNGRELYELLIANDGIFMGSDEYTGSYSARFRNAVAWIMAAQQNRASIFKDKPVALCGTSARGVGGLRGLPALRQLLAELGAEVISQQISLGTSASAFDSAGELMPDFKKQLLDGSLGKLVHAVASPGSTTHTL